jgi:cullin 1
VSKVETWLREEKNIIVACLHPDTFGPLMRTCNQSLLQNHVGRMGDEFLFHLESRDQLELHRMFNHLSSIPNALNEFYHQFSKHVMRVELFATSSLVNGTADSSTAKAYIKELLEIHAYYDTLIKTAFASDAKFLRCFDEWFVQFVNKNGVCQQKPDKSAMLLAAHADSLLRESIHTQEIELADKLAGVMTIFQYLMDKETFHIAYSKRMADRLLKGRSLSVQAEKLMIGSLHEAGGFEHTRKLETMLEDTKISSALNVEFQRWLRESGWLRVGAGVSFQVLRAWSWPLAIDPSSSGTSFIPPKSIANAHSRFDKFYKSKHVGRELRWMWHLCNGELKANFDSSPRAPYVFRVSAYQMSILLLFNSHATISYDSIQQKTGLGEEHLHQYLSVFLYAGLLNISPDSSHPVSGTQFALNPNFSSPKIKVNLLRNGGAERERKNIEEIRAEQERQRCLEV